MPEREAVVHLRVLMDDVATEDQLGTAHQTEDALLEKYAWQLDRGAQGNKTADIQRYYEGGSVYYAHVEPTQEAVDGLEDLPVWVDDYTKEYIPRHGIMGETSDKMFIFYDLIGDKAESDDVIVYDGDEYSVASIWYDSASGRCEVRGKLAGQDTRPARQAPGGGRPRA